MGILILCIDRDNDLGRKTSIASPVIGRKKNLHAAELLALADPEDSDINCMFSAISTYDELRDKDAEIVTICGDIDVGTKSDQIIASHLDAILEKFKPESVILVTDGAEDEYVLPMVESRVKITSVKRTVVKQSRGLEGTYYLIARFLEDEKMQRKFVLPISLILVIWGFFAIIGSSVGFAAILLILGFYLLFRALHLVRFITGILKGVSMGLRSGKISLLANLVALFVIIGSFINAYNLSPIDASAAPLRYSLLFLGNVIWWVIVAVLISAGGHFADVYLREKRVLWNYSIIPFSLPAFGLIFSVCLDILLKIIQGEDLTNFFTPYIFMKVVGGIVTAVVGIILYHRMEERYGEVAIQPEAQ